MCNWCEKLDLTRTYEGQTIDYTEYVHKEDSPFDELDSREAWKWLGRHNTAVRLFEQRKSIYFQKKRSEELLEERKERYKKKEKKERATARAARVEEMFFCLYPECGKKISYLKAAQSGLCGRHRSQFRRYEKKKRLFEWMGGKCEVCGTVPPLAAVSFHHVDPSQKEFTIGTSINLAEDALKKELEKCIAVCENCHREIHSSYDDELFAHFRDLGC